MENNQGGGNKNVYKAIIIVLLLINFGAIYFLYTDSKVKKDLTSQQANLQKEYKEVNDSLDAKKDQLEQFRGKNAQLDSIISAKEQDIDNQKKQMSSLQSKNKLNKNELDKAKKMITEYEASIADLQKKVDELTKQNQVLNTQNQQLNTDLSSEKKNTATLSEQNKGLSKKVELGSLLQLRNVTVEGIEKKKNGKEVVEKKVKKVSSLRISFETGDNKVLEPANMSLYIRIINPKGETISVADKGSSTLKLAESGENIQYTKKADFDWSQTNKKIMVYWDDNIKDAGTYKIEVYQSGYVIGLGSVDLK